jgi:hypothetical protein
MWLFCLCRTASSGKENVVNFLHWSFRAQQGNIVEVTIDRAANVLLLSEAEYERFRRGMSYNYRGGNYTVSPVRIPVPYHSWWHIVVYPGPVSASMRVI